MKGLRKLGFGLCIFVAIIIPSLFGNETSDGIEFLVLPSRNQTRMQAEIFHAFVDAGKRIIPNRKIDFVLFNPFKHEVSEEGDAFQAELEKFMRMLNECIPEVIAIKKSHPRTDKLLMHMRNFMKNNPKSQLADLHSEIDKLMMDFDFLIIESSDTYGVHPVFYQPSEIRVNTPDGASAEDIIEALYGLFFLDAAFQQNKPVWGACHGAQIGYIHAGGKLGRLFEYNKDGYDVDFKRTGPISGEEEIWCIHNVLETNKKNSRYFKYGQVVRPVPEFFKSADNRGNKLKMNKDFEHSFGLVKPIPDGIKVISYHPLSEIGKIAADKKYVSGNKAFKKVISDQLIIDAYKYKTMLGTQYHPQYTYDELDMAIIFEYLLKQVTAMPPPTGSDSSKQTGK